VIGLVHASAPGIIAGAAPSRASDQRAEPRRPGDEGTTSPGGRIREGSGPNSHRSRPITPRMPGRRNSTEAAAFDCAVSMMRNGSRT
jgi:hypothetical protein